MSKRQKGSALVEFAVILPVLVMLLLGGVDLIEAFSTSSTMGYIAEETSRCMALNSPACSTLGATAYARQLAQELGVPNSKLVTALQNPCTGCTSITISYQYHSLFHVLPSPINMQRTFQSVAP